ncbi:MAG TPA: hypothetical protein PKA74_00330 [Bauldia sp.]|nr:hypothetical protein [Bauldia sp.]
MAHRWLLVAALALPFVAALSAHAAPDGRPVQTETIVVPPGPDDHAMPPIPSDETEGPVPGDTDPAAPAAADEPVPVVEYDPAKLPTPVRRLRDQIIEAAETGDIEKLRPIIDANEEPPDFSFNEAGDPIEYLKSLSGDPEGREILAILIEILEAGYVHVDVGTPNEAYVWPYFARYPVDKLSPRQLVELFRIVFAGDYEDMKTFGTYLSFRTAITPDGQWAYFLVGD